MQQNEIRDFIERAPKKVEFNGKEIVLGDGARRRWLEEMASGDIHERINRRAGVKVHEAPIYAPWRGVRASIRRHIRRGLARQGMREMCYLYPATL